MSIMGDVKSKKVYKLSVEALEVPGRDIKHETMELSDNVAKFIAGGMSQISRPWGRYLSAHIVSP